MMVCREIERERADRVNATLGPERGSREKLHATIYINCYCKGCRLPHHGAAGVPREIVWGGGERTEREGQPACRERERETAESERDSDRGQDRE